MNYIRHLNAFFSYVKTDNRLTSSHVSLYLAMFQYWNFNRFQNPFPVYRDNIMQLSKVGSKNTYHKCLKELHEAKYIYYHPSASRFLPVKISMARLDIDVEQASRYEQLDLFGSPGNKSQDSETINLTVTTPSPEAERSERGQENTCPNNETNSVPDLTATCPKNETVPVPEMGHNIKHKHFYKRESKTRPQKIFDKNEKINQGINNLGRVPNSIHTTPSSFSIVTQAEVHEFFKQNSYPDSEAKKFFNHYQAIGWKIKGVTPIEDWRAAANKWMLNAENFEDKKQQVQLPTKVDSIEILYKKFSAGENIFRHITTVHFQELNLQVTETTLSYARQHRINQLTGSNQRSVLQLLQAYLDNKENDALLLSDHDNLITLAKRITVITHFHQLKESGRQPAFTSNIADQTNT